MIIHENPPNRKATSETAVSFCVKKGNVMAVKVIEYGKQRVKCDKCESALEYEKEDIETMQTGMNEYQNKIICPVCNNTIYVR